MKYQFTSVINVDFLFTFMDGWYVNESCIYFPFRESLKGCLTFIYQE